MDATVKQPARACDRLRCYSHRIALPLPFQTKFRPHLRRAFSNTLSPGTSNDQPYFNGANGFPFTAAGGTIPQLSCRSDGFGPSVYAVKFCSTFAANSLCRVGRQATADKASAPLFETLEKTDDDCNDITVEPTQKACTPKLDHQAIHCRTSGIVRCHREGHLIRRISVIASQLESSKADRS